MLKIIRFELSKQLNRKENLILLFVFFIPLLYSIGIYSNSKVITYNSSDPVNGLAFASNMYTFVYMVFIFYLVLAINSANILRGEIDNRSISILLTRINDRSKIYKGKLYAQALYWIVVTVLFVIFSIICYYLFISKLEISSGKLVGDKYLSEILTIIAVCSSYVLVISMVQSISMYHKTFVSLGIFIVVWIIMLYLKAFPVVKFISPIYYLEYLMDSGKFIDFMKFMAINWSAVFLFSFIGNKKFRGRNL